MAGGMSAQKYYFIARMPDEPGALHTAAEIVKRYQGNIERIHYDRRIDPYVVFFEVTCEASEYEAIERELKAIGYLQTSLTKLGFLKFKVILPHRAGALFEFLHFTTEAHCNIAFLDFDDRSKNPDQVTVSLTIDDVSKLDWLLERLRSRYPLEILEYDLTGKRLDDTVFYIRFAQELRQIIGEQEDQFLMKLLSDINHIVQELTNLDMEPKSVFESVLETGRTLKATTGPGFYADVQVVQMTEEVSLFCFQPPCGGNIYALRDREGFVLIDTGYGIYKDDVKIMLARYGMSDLSQLKGVYITHADADHSGGAWSLPAVAHVHPGTAEIVQAANRAYGSMSESSVLEAVYTKLINLFSAFRPPEEMELYDLTPEGEVMGLDVIGVIQIGDVRLKVLNGLGGHLHGQVFFVAEGEALLFTGDSLIDLKSISEERSRFNLLAKNLMTSVNVDSARADEERKVLIELARMLSSPDRERPCLVCGGHGTISYLDQKRLRTFGHVDRYPMPSWEDG
jgi:glyoxylase-like metal-dependent hydrolase (beta-lactamase superfamily II)